MAHSSIKFNKSTKLILGVAGWMIIGLAVATGAGFYAGYNYKATQDAATKAAVQDALKAVAPAPAVAVEAPKS